MNSDTNLYPLQKSFGWFYCTEFFQMEKRGTKNRHCQLSIFKENTEAHNLQYFHLFYLSGLWCFEGFFLSLIFLYVLLELHWFIFAQSCELYILHFLFTLVLIFSLQQKNYDGNDDHEDDNRNAESDNHDQSVVVGRGICRWKIKQLIITFYPKISYSIYRYFIICYHNYIKLWTTQNSLTILTEFSIR